MKANVINFKGKVREEVKRGGLTKKLEELGLIFFPMDGGNFALDEEKVVEWLDKRTLSGEKMKVEEEEKIDQLIFLTFLVNVIDLNLENYDYVNLFIERLSDKKFKKHFEKQLPEIVYKLIEINLNNLVKELSRK